MGCACGEISLENQVASPGGWLNFQSCTPNPHTKASIREGSALVAMRAATTLGLGSVKITSLMDSAAQKADMEKGF